MDEQIQTVSVLDILRKGSDWLDSVAGGVVAVRADGSIEACNREALRILGLSFDQITRRYIQDFETETIREDGSLFPVDEYPVTLALRTRESQPGVLLGVRHKSGFVSWGVYTAIPVFQPENGTLAGAFVTFVDVTQSVIAHRELEETRANWESLIKYMPHQLSEMDRDGIIVAANRTLSQRGIEDVVGRSIFDFVTPETGAIILEHVRSVWDSGKPDTYRLIAELNGQTYHFQNSLWPVFLNGKVKSVANLATNVTAAVAMEQNLIHSSRHDALTGLFNRNYFRSVLDREIQNAAADSNHAVCYIDLDQFKIVNDTCGHGAGDELLRQVAQLIQALLRDTDILARLGGDEFGLLIVNTTNHAVEIKAAEILRRIDAYRFSWEGLTFRIGASIGIVKVDGTSKSHEHVMRDADSSCFAAKERGRNRWHIFKPEDEWIRRRSDEMNAAAEIARAVDEDRLMLYGQGILRFTETGTEPAGRELLLRIRGRDGQVLAPAAYLQAAERFHTIQIIDAWVLRNALSVMAGPGLNLAEYVSVNISGITIAEPSFLVLAEEMIRQSKVNPARLVFEITETAATKDLNQTVAFMTRLKQAGCRFALDDFGAGAASFGYLRELPVDKVKIDGSFVRNVQDDAVSRIIVKSVVDIARQTGLTTVAECVETQAQADLIRSLGIDCVQGWAFEKPRAF